MDDILKPENRPQSSSSSYETPFDVVELPSRGKLYNGTTLEGRDSLEVHYLTAKEEDILTSPNLIQSGRLLDVLIKSVLKDKTINPEELLVGDRNTIMVWLRSTGYGPEYPVNITCQSCGTSYEHEFDLSTLEIRTLEFDPPNPDGTFDCELLIRKDKITYSLMTSKQEYELVKRTMSKKKLTSSSTNETTTSRLKAIIKSVNGDTSPTTISKYVDTMPAGDSIFLRRLVEGLEPGVIMKQEIECPSCGDIRDGGIPIQANFFWPESGS
jgi:hypothetical protein